MLRHCCDWKVCLGQASVTSFWQLFCAFFLQILLDDRYPGCGCTLQCMYWNLAWVMLSRPVNWAELSTVVRRLHLSRGPCVQCLQGFPELWRSLRLGFQALTRGAKSGHVGTKWEATSRLWLRPQCQALHSRLEAQLVKLRGYEIWKVDTSRKSWHVNSV